ncbi:hypothetical protein [Roseimarinus sediminis]|uniref:hypothetical protein n=1 Tax=Roseimarinus sediminis TaxID=1610899 RepID=UPI003D2308CA
MTATIEHIDSQNLEFRIIDSKSFYVIKIIGIFLGVIGVLIGASIFQRGTNRNLMSLFTQLPFWLEMTLGLLSFVLIGISVTLQLNKNSKKGKLQLSIDSIEFDSKKISLDNKSITISINKVKNKNIYKRSFLEGSNNWIIIKSYNKPDYKFEFLIESKTQEDNLIELIEYWRTNSNEIKLENQKPSFWQTWNDF